MKTIILLISVIAIGLIGLFILSLMSRSGNAIGLKDGQLTACPGSPNCVCSEHPSSDFWVEPIPIDEAGIEQSWALLRESVKQMGGDLQKESEGYLAATFTTKWLRFSDDLEARLDQQAGLIHLRSASRVGHSDFGVNRQRITQLKALYEESLKRLQVVN